jgi:hypothetical protein
MPCELLEFVVCTSTGGAITERKIGTRKEWLAPGEEPRQCLLDKAGASGLALVMPT